MVKVLIVTLLLAMASPATPPVSISANPQRGLSPLTTTIKYSIERHVDNRQACLAYDGPKYSISCFDVTTDDPITRWVEVKRLPAGKYHFTITVLRADSSTRQASVDVCSIENEDCE